MGPRLGRMTITCDAPPYPVVRACRKAGFVAPADVRWCHAARFVRRSGWQALLPLRLWRRFWGAGRAAPPACSCGRELPPLVPVFFLARGGAAVHYRLGQCGRCRTMFWEAGGAAAGAPEEP